RVDRAREGILRIARTPEREVDDVDVLTARPRHRREHRVLASAVAGERLRDDERGLRRDAAIDVARARDDPGDVRAVTDVVDVAALGEILHERDATREVRVPVGAGVDDRDVDARALEAGVPDRGDVLRGNALVQEREDRLWRPRVESRRRETAAEG